MRCPPSPQLLHLGELEGALLCSRMPSCRFGVARQVIRNTMHTYYTHDTTRYPIAALWDDLAPVPVVFRILSFAYLLIRRTLGLHLPATYGESDTEPEWISVAADIPANIIASAAEAVAEAGESGFHLSHAARHHTIGSKHIYWLYLIEEQLTAFLRLQVVIYDELGGESEIQWACCSFRENGVGIHTFPSEKGLFGLSHAAGHEYHAVPISSSITDVIDAHLAIVAAESDIGRITESIAKDSCRRSAERFVKQMINSGHLRPLSAREVERMKNRSPGMATGCEL